jgi:hypothetical protein
MLLVTHDSRDAMLRNGTIAAYEFEVSLAGHIVGCESLADAVAIKAANDILTGEDPTTYSSDQLRPIVAVLLRYAHVSS